MVIRRHLLTICSSQDVRRALRYDVEGDTGRPSRSASVGTVQGTTATHSPASHSEPPFASPTQQSAGSNASIENPSLPMQHKTSRSDVPEQINRLLLLLCFLAGPDMKVELSLLTLIGYQRTQWTDDGEQRNYSALEVGLFVDLHRLLQHPQKLEQALSDLRRRGHIRIVHSGTLSIIQLDPEVKRMVGIKLDTPSRSFWEEQALLAACYLFTGNANSRE
jgi:hypothetical protein